MAISKQIVYIGDFLDEANKLRATYGRTELYSTGHPSLDIYLHGQDPRHHKGYEGGFGRKDGYEIVLLYGPTGIGKSTVALNLIMPAVIAKKKVGLLILEDDMADVSVRLSFLLNDDQYREMNSSHNVRCLPKKALVKAWTLNELLDYIESWFNDGIELILLDHLQFAFEGAESIKGENEYTSQRVFMQRLNALMKKHKKTIILISHMNKNTGAKGMDRIQGSGSIAQASTKSIEVSKDPDNGDIVFWFRKSRFTKTPDHAWHMKFRGTKLETIT